MSNLTAVRPEIHEDRDASDIMIVRTSRGMFTWSARDGLQPSDVPYWYYAPGIVSFLLDPPDYYWQWLAETATDL